MFEYGVGKLAMTELIGAISACFIIESSQPLTKEYEPKVIKPIRGSPTHLEVERTTVSSSEKVVDGYQYAT